MKKLNQLTKLGLNNLSANFLTVVVLMLAGTRSYNMELAGNEKRLGK